MKTTEPRELGHKDASTLAFLLTLIIILLQYFCIAVKYEPCKAVSSVWIGILGFIINIPIIYFVFKGLYIFFRYKLIKLLDRFLLTNPKGK